MTLQEKLYLEQHNSSTIHLYKEGAFWRAYGVSCMLFHRLFPHFKVLCVQTRQRSYFYLGLPDKKLVSYHQKLLDRSINPIEAPTDVPQVVGQPQLQLSFQTSMEISKTEYEECLHHLIQKQQEKKKPPRFVVWNNERMQYLIQKIKSIDLENTTPVDALLCLQELKEFVAELDV